MNQNQKNYQDLLRESKFDMAKAIIFEILKNKYAELPYRYLRFFLPIVLRCFIPKSVLDSQDRFKKTFLHLTLDVIYEKNPYNTGLTDEYYENIEEIIHILLILGADPNI